MLPISLNAQNLRHKLGALQRDFNLLNWYRTSTVISGISILEMVLFMAKSKEQLAESKEPLPESKDQSAESREQLAESKEQSVEASMAKSKE